MNSKNPYSRRREHYIPVVASTPLSAFQTGQADRADGLGFTCHFVNVDDRQDYFLGYNAPLDLLMARIPIPGGAGRRRARGQRDRLPRLPAQRTDLSCYRGEGE